MRKPTILERELEEVAEWASHAYPTAEAISLGEVRALRTLEPGADRITCCRSCRHRRELGYFTSGPLAGGGLWVCDCEWGEC